LSNDHYAYALSDAVTVLGRAAVKNGGALRLDARCDGQPVTISVKIVRPPNVRRRDADATRPEGLEPPPPETWDSDYVRQLLAERNIGAVYRYLIREYRYSQIELGSLTGQSQAEVSAIAGGHREVLRLDVLERIAARLGIRPCLVGLACPDCKHQPLPDKRSEDAPVETEPTPSEPADDMQARDGPPPERLAEAEEAVLPQGSPVGIGLIFLAPPSV
jgi:transcriptional regulator with XRE-family HTH domain